MADLDARQVRGQCQALRLALVGLCRWRGAERFELDLDRLQVGFKVVVQEAALLGAERLAARGKLPPLENGDLVGERIDLYARRLEVEVLAAQLAAAAIELAASTKPDQSVNAVGSNQLHSTGVAFGASPVAIL